MDNKELRALIKLLSRNNVKKYKSEEIELEFGDNIPLVTHAPVKKVKQDEDIFDEIDEARLKEQLAQELLLENPLQYEEMLANET